MTLFTIMAVLAAEPANDYPRVVRKGDLTCVQSLDAKGAVTEQCRKEGAGGYEPRYPRNITRGDQLCEQSLDANGKVVESCRPAPVRPADAPRAPAGDYPRVLRRGSETCVQSLDERGALVETCRSEQADYQPKTSPDETTLTPRPRRAAKLLENSDPAAGRRMVVEGLAGLLLGPAPLVILGAVCGSRPCDAAPVLVAVVASAALMGLAAGVAHVLQDGQAGVGWGLIGSTIGLGAAAVLVYLASQLAVGGYVGFVLYALAGVLPIASTLIALELRDTQLRYGPGPEESPGASWGPTRATGFAVRF